MTTIWKFELDVTQGDRVCISIPKGAVVLSAGVQGRNFMVWAIVDPAAPKVNRNFSVHGTGHSVPAEIEWSAFINTVFMGPLVFHIFDLGEQL